MITQYKPFLFFGFITILCMHLGCTAPLYLIIDSKSDISRVQNCLDNGADVNAKNKYGTTALMYAAEYSRADIAKILINNGADVNAKNNGGETALMYAAQHAQNDDVATLLVNNGADVNAKNKGGKTALMYAAEWGRIDIAQLLVNVGADINAKNTKGNTALMYAANHFLHIEIAKLLVDKGAEVNAKDQTGRTCLMKVANLSVSFPSNIFTLIDEKKQQEFAKLLINRGADVNAQDFFGNTAWMYSLNASLPKRNELADSLIKKSNTIHPGFAIIIFHKHLSLLELDGAPALRMAETLYELLEPGNHTLELTFTRQFFEKFYSGEIKGKPTFLKINAKINSVYAINYDYNSGMWKAWIEQYK